MEEDVVISEQHGRSVPKTVMGITKREIKENRKKLRETLPVLTPNEIRRHRIPLHKAVIMEMEEEGYCKAAEFMSQLIETDDSQRKDAEPDSLVFRRPFLKTNSKCLDMLKEGLQEAKAFLRKESSPYETAALIRLALRFVSLGEYWWWLAEEIFRLCINCAKAIKVDGGRCNATAHFLYGRFLSEELVEYKRAEYYLEEARRISAGRSWPVDEAITTVHYSIHIATCILLNRIQLQLGKEIRKRNPREAIKYCIKAHRRAKECNREDAIANSLYELSISHMSVEEYNETIPRLIEYAEICTQLPDYEGLCKANMQIGLCYKGIGEKTKSYEHMKISHDIADTHNFPRLSALAKLHLGEMNLDIDQFQNAVSILTSARYTFKSLSMHEEVDVACVLLAVAAGQDIMEDVCDIVAYGSIHSVIKYAMWKDSEKSYYTDDVGTVIGIQPPIS